MPSKRKRPSVAATSTPSTSLSSIHETPVLPPASSVAIKPPPAKRQASHRGKVDTNPDHNVDIVDGKAALRASPDADEAGGAFDVKGIANKASKTSTKKNGTNGPTKNEDSDSSLSDVPLEKPIMTSVKKQKKTPTKSSIAAKKGSDEIKAFKAEQAANKVAEAKIKKEDADEWEQRLDPDGDEAGPLEDVDVLKREAGRPPPVNSDYLPLPWKGRLGYACLNTYLRFSNPPVFSSRTCRIASILEHRHPLKDPTQPEHATKNRPDKSRPASVERGLRYVEELGLANAKDIAKMLRWNDKYGIKFLRLSSEMFPFASHLEYGYKLAPFASEALVEAGRVAAELGHRLSTHPGQFTQLGSPRQAVIANAIRDLEYHDELLSLLKLPPQGNRDAVMILHMGGTFGDKAATLDRFRANYKDLSHSIKMRLVLENDDVSWSVHDLLPICEELNIPLCLDFHHHNIIFDNSQLREGTLDIMSLFPRIKALWDRKSIRQKMHYSEPTPEAITGRQRRKHNPRPSNLPPCPNDMDLMIEAKDKEQAVFELMRTFKLPGWDIFNNIIPYERSDDNKPLPKNAKKKKTKKRIAEEIEEYGRELKEEEEISKEYIPEEDIGMGGKQNRVYWPAGMEEWLRPKKRDVKKKDSVDEEDIFKYPTPANFAARQTLSARNKASLGKITKEKLSAAKTVAEVQKILDEIKAGANADVAGQEDYETPTTKKAKSTPVKKTALANRKTVNNRPSPSITNIDDEEEDLTISDLSGEEHELPKVTATGVVPARQSIRAIGKRKSYVEDKGDFSEPE